MNKTRFVYALVVAGLLFGIVNTHADEACPTIVHPEWALAAQPLPTRVIANTVVYGYMYIRYGVTYLQSLILTNRPAPDQMDLYQRPIFTEARAFCAGDVVLVDGRLGAVVAVEGSPVADDPHRRAQLGIPRDATNYVAEDGAVARIKFDESIESIPAAKVALAGSTLWYPSLTKSGEDGQIDAGAEISDCGAHRGVFRRAFALPGQTIRAAQDIRVQLNDGTVRVEDLCVELPTERRISVQLRSGPHAKVVRLRGFGKVDVRFPDHTERTLFRGQLARP